MPDVPGRNDNNRLQAGDPVQVAGTFTNYVALGNRLGKSANGVGYQGVPTLIATRIGVARA